MNQINRMGNVYFYDASIRVIEDPDFSITGKAGQEWQHKFKMEVFARIVQQLNRMSWTVLAAQEITKLYGKLFALNYRECNKGDLFGELSLSGRVIEFKMWQNIANIDRSDGKGKYEFDKERRMPYLLRLEMERTRRKIRDYLCNVFDGYEFCQQPQKVGPRGVTAIEYIMNDYRNNWHYNKELDHPSGNEHVCNNMSGDGSTIIHGSKVYAVDWHGKLIYGTAMYNINNMWWVVTGKYGYQNIACFHIYTKKPDDVRAKFNHRQRENQLIKEIKIATNSMEFERAAILRDILGFNKGDRQ